MYLIDNLFDIWDTTCILSVKYNCWHMRQTCILSGEDNWSYRYCWHLRHNMYLIGKRNNCWHMRHNMYLIGKRTIVDIWDTTYILSVGDNCWHMRQHVSYREKDNYWHMRLCILSVKDNCWHMRHNIYLIGKRQLLTYETQHVSYR